MTAKFEMLRTSVTSFSTKTDKQVSQLFGFLSCSSELFTPCCWHFTFHVKGILGSGFALTVQQKQQRKMINRRRPLAASLVQAAYVRQHLQISSKVFSFLLTSLGLATTAVKLQYSTNCQTFTENAASTFSFDFALVHLWGATINSQTVNGSGYD